MNSHKMFWLIIAISCAALATHLAAGLAADTHNDLYVYDDRISDGEKGWDLEIYDGRYIALVFAFPDRLVRHYGPKTPEAPKGWAFERKVDVLTYFSLQEAIDAFLSVVDENCPKFKFVDGKNSPDEPRHFTVNIHDPEGDRKAVEIVFIGNRADVNIHNGYIPTDRTESFLNGLKATIQQKKIIEG